MISGARKLPASHLTVRVPWHDAYWNGTVCKNPCGNTSCTVLPRIGTTKDEVAEACRAGESLEGIAEDDLPPCVDEHATVMAKFGLTLHKQHPYRETAKATHGHFETTPYSLEPFSAAAIPFRWMLREQIEGNSKKKLVGKAEQYALGYEPSREPELEFGETWVQEGQNQRVMLDTFFSAVERHTSLVFLYAKRTPLSERAARVIVGVGRVLKVGEPIQYRVSKDRPRGAISGYLWERNVHHSIRADGSDGFLLPYQDLLEKAESDASIDVESCTAFAPDECFAQYSYGSELLDQDGAIASLLACERAIQQIRQHIDGPWAQRLEWIDRELNRLWKIRGAFPGIGAALSAFGIAHGNLLAWHLAEGSKDGADLWARFESMLKDPSGLPLYLKEEVGPTLAKKWQVLAPNRKALLKLLSRFVLTNEQAKRWYLTDVRKEEGISLTDAQIL